MTRYLRLGASMDLLLQEVIHSERHGLRTLQSYRAFYVLASRCPLFHPLRTLDGAQSG